MTQPSRFSGLLPNTITKIALRIRNRMNKLEMNESGLALKCNQLSYEVLQEVERPRMTRDRIAKILMNCKARPEKSAARVITYQEILVISHALKVAPEWIMGQEGKRDPILWNPLADPRRAEHILHLLGEYEEQAGEITVWAEFLLCSLVTPEFMHEYHNVHFEELELLGLHQAKSEVVQIFDHIGNARRERLLGGKSKRRYSFTQIIFLSEIEKICKGSQEYNQINKEVRESCIENLRNLITDASLRINLVIVPDNGTEGKKRFLRDFDSLGVFGKKFTIWSYHSGNVAWSEHPNYIEPHYHLLKDFQDQAIYQNRKEAAKYLNVALRIML
jgi:hypothetical protein